MSIEIVPVSPDDLRHVQDQIVAVYGAAFALPPYGRTIEDAEWFRASLEQHAELAGFRCVIAREREGDRIAGFTYGYTGAPGQWWADVVNRAMNREMVRRWLTHYFELVELAVLPELQRRGIGGRLHDALLEGLPHRTAALSTIQEETPAWHLYRKRGWVVLLEHLLFPNVPEPYQIMGKELHPARAAGG